jgi:hypothetical protein
MSDEHQHQVINICHKSKPSYLAYMWAYAHLANWARHTLLLLLLQEVRGVKALVVLLVDLLDASGTLMSKVRRDMHEQQLACP